MRKIIFFCTMIMLMSFKLAYAEGSYITCDTQVSGTKVTISGQIVNATKQNEVILMVGNDDNVIYINQIKSSDDGQFVFDFSIPADTPSGEYGFRINSDSDAEAYVGTLNYSSNLTAVRNKIMEANIEIIILGYEPNVCGDIYCTEDKKINIHILKKTDNTEIYNQTIVPSDGRAYISFKLPKLLYPTEYEMVVNCTDNTNKILAEMTVDINSRGLILETNVLANTAENVDIKGGVRSDTNIINKEFAFSGRKEKSLTIPNILRGGNIKLNLEGYEKIYTDFGYSRKYIKNISKYGEKFLIAVNVFDLEAHIKDRTFTILYPHNDDVVILDDLCKFTQRKDLKEGLIEDTNITVLEYKPGYIRFKVDEEMPEGSFLTRTVNVIGFIGNVLGEQIIELIAQGDRVQ